VTEGRAAGCHTHCGGSEKDEAHRKALVMVVDDGVDKRPRAALKWSVRLTTAGRCSMRWREDISMAGGGGPCGEARGRGELATAGGSGNHSGSWQVAEVREIEVEVVTVVVARIRAGGGSNR
jgi:hypothetical protein